MYIKAKGEMCAPLKKALSLIPKEFPNSNREEAVSQHLKFVSYNRYLKYQIYSKYNNNRNNLTPMRETSSNQSSFVFFCQN